MYEQFKDLVRRFTFEHSNDEPDWTKLRILHAWGSKRENGIYSEITNAYGMEAKTFNYAKDVYGYKSAFKGVCDELLSATSNGPLPRPLYDVILIDEAQDLPESFFKLVYSVVENPKRIIWAYDDLQNLVDYTMLPPSDLFGIDDHQLPLIDLHNTEGQARQDIVLPICYRNTPWALATAHALGLGIYRKEGLVQFYDDFNLWKNIGYEVVSGDLAFGSNISMRRSINSSPEFFKNVIDPSDAVNSTCFETELEQAKWVAENIQKNLTVDEVDEGVKGKKYRQSYCRGYYGQGLFIS
ncbi:hypothetical protein ABEV54_14315 [Peribacillus psychrosaccharolyticus]|uniref:hypothetical protein n=1 Tax=Peribacillus psychrosaccharolyticus TaxID=1407 RepID=UPI003D294B60